MATPLPCLLGLLKVRYEAPCKGARDDVGGQYGSIAIDNGFWQMLKLVLNERMLHHCSSP